LAQVLVAMEQFTAQAAAAAVALITTLLGLVAMVQTASFTLSGSVQTFKSFKT
jgi:hypothetical protein